MNRLVSVLETIINVLSKQGAALLLFIMMLLVMTEAGARYFFNNPLMVADEVGGYLLALIGALGLAYTWRAGGHIRVAIVVDRVPVRIRKWLRLVTLLIATALTWLLFTGSYELVAFSVSFGRRSDTWLRVPLSWPQTALIVGYGLLLLYQVIHLVQAVKALRTPGEESG
ncbi:MAG: TRAP transporter small permease subunit [Chloroflexi bacterium]|nr:TRAP transporter small permease subunit [Chloroflexota bacterium]